MGRDPAFLFYPNDYIGGTMGMTFEEKGAYIELLMMQFNRGHMTSHMIGQTIGQLWDKVQDKFIQDDKGFWYNKRLEDEKIKRQNYTNSRKNNMKGTNQYTKKPEKESGHMTSHMENENRNEDINKKKKHKHGMYENVLLTDEEKEKLSDKFNGTYQDRIDRLSEYMESTGKVYKSHYATVLSWARKETGSTTKDKYTYAELMELSKSSTDGTIEEQRKFCEGYKKEGGYWLKT